MAIDREEVCDRELAKCIFNAEIITTPQSMFQLFKVEIEIEDLNDNSPVFPKTIIDVNLSEEAQLGHLLRLGERFFGKDGSHISLFLNPL